MKYLSLCWASLTFIAFNSFAAELTDGFRTFRWGMEPLKVMEKLSRKSNMDVYAIPNDDRNVAGINATGIYYLFYGSGLCRIEVRWVNLSDDQLNIIKKALSEYWGKPKETKEYSDLYSSSWTSKSGLSVAHFSGLDPVSTTERDWLMTLVIQQSACSKSAVEGHGL